ncbi:MAG: YdcF family protein [bacterium]
MLSLTVALLALAAGLALAALRLRWPWLLLPAVGFGLALALDGGFVGQKALARLAMPAGALWLLGYLGLVAILHAGHGRAAVAAGALWLLYTLAGNLWLGGALLRHLEAPFTAWPAGRFDAALVLGGGTAVRPDGDPQLGPAGDRLRVAARLYRAGQVDHLVTCGTSVAGIQQVEERDLAEETAALWAGWGVPGAAIVRVPGPRNTREEIAALRALVTAHGWQRVAVITSAWHLPRALALAEAAGLQVVPIGADFRGEAPVPGVFGLIPSANGLYRVQTAAWELLGRATGR